MTVSVGDVFPTSGVSVQEGTPKDEVNLDTIFKGKTVVVFGVPGAFTPGCNKTHLPGYIKDYEALKSKGVDEIVCISVNDAFVMAEWGKISGADGKVRMIADTNAQLVKKLGLDLLT